MKTHWGTTSILLPPQYNNHLSITTTYFQTCFYVSSVSQLDNEATSIIQSFFSRPKSGPNKEVLLCIEKLVRINNQTGCIIILQTGLDHIVQSIMLMTCKICRPVNKNDHNKTGSDKVDAYLPKTHSYRDRNINIEETSV